MITNTELITSILKDISGDKERILLRSYVDDKQVYFFCKRAFDVIISLVFIVFILSWLLPIICLVIKLNARGPVFFSQKRVGRGGKSFTCYKFCTMVVNGEANEKQAEEDDLRITRVGKFLRKSNLDELPQFLNVLAGDMSIVGPRPHMYTDCNKFSSIVSGYKFRNMVKPGITGLAQVKGFHGPTMNYESIFRRFQWDAFYVRNAGFWMDVRIVHRTIIQRIGFLLMYL